LRERSKLQLKKNTIIRSLLAAFMLVVFAFSITPKIVLHDFIANHKDTPFKSNFEKDAQLNKAGFNCSCDNLVVESPFTVELAPVQIIIASVFPARLTGHTNNFNSGHHFYFELRGPPAEIAA
jgi:hypothetical protein